MSCLSANITVVEYPIKPSLTKANKGLKISLSIVCRTHNSLAMLVNDSKLLFDGEKVLLV